MKHEEFRELLPLYIDGGLDKNEVERLEAHLAECEECREELAQYQENYDFLTSVEDVEVSSDFLASVMKRIEGEKTQATEANVDTQARVQSGPTIGDRIKSLMKRRFQIPVGAMGLAVAAMVILLLVGPLSNLGGYRNYTKDGAPEEDGYGLRNETQYEIMYDTMEAPKAEPLQKMKFAAPQSEAAPEAAPLTAETDRKIIKTANLRVEVKDVSAAEKQIINIARDVNGFISHSNSWVAGSNQKYTNYQLRVPVDGFYDALERVEALGAVKNRVLGGQDVTEEYFDTEARLENYRHQEKRYLELLSKAVDVEDMLAIEHELERVRGMIESLQGRINYLDNRVSMSTIDVEISEPEPITPSNNWGIVDVLRQAIRETLNTFSNILIALGRMLPYLILFGLAYLVYRLRKRKGKQ